MRRLSVVIPLGIAQTLAWASSYYLLAILAEPIAHETGASTSLIYGAFSGALLLSGLIGPQVGRTIDRVGGRAVLAISNLCFAAGLFLLGLATAWPLICAGWLFLGLGMGLGLYDAAFAALGRIYGTSARSAITGITLMAGFASTVGWPLTAWALDTFGWREACFGWAAIHLLIGAPLNLTLPGKKRFAVSAIPSGAPAVAMDGAMWLLAFAFAAGWTISTAIAAHLPRLLEAWGASEAHARFVGTLIGPAQVVARLVESGLLRRFHPLNSARLSAALHPLGVALLCTGAGGVTVFALLHGAGNGILTIARGTVPLALYGPVNYGYRLGLLGAPSRVAQAAAPLAFSLLIDRFGAYALFFSAALGLFALAALSLVATTTAQPEKM